MKILLTVNGTAKSESILPLVHELARRWQAEVLIVRALDPLVGMGDPLVPLLAESFHDQLVHSGEEYLRAIEKRLPDVPVRSFCPVGSAGECIRQLALDEKCDLLVMASHGHTGFVRWLWGSVAEGLTRNAPCPVLLVRRDTPSHFRQILIPVEAWQPSQQVAERLGPFVESDAQITLLHCGLPSDLPPGAHLEFSSTAAPEGIYEWLADHPCDLIAMATHGREGLAHLWTGSITEQIARHAHCPVLVFPPPQVRNSE